MTLIQKSQMRVGIFLTVGLFIFVLCLVFLGADRSLIRSSKKFHLILDSGQGLVEGSYVSLLGIIVGHIDKINWDIKKNKLDLVLKVEEPWASQIRADTKAEVKTQGALGDKFIFLNPGTEASEFLKDGDEVIALSTMDWISEGERVFAVLKNVEKLTQGLNKDQRIEKILLSLEQFSKSLDQKTIPVLNSSLARVDRILEKVEHGQGTLGALINDPSVHNKLKSLLGISTRGSLLPAVMQNSIPAGKSAPKN